MKIDKHGRPVEQLGSLGSTHNDKATTVLNTDLASLLKQRVQDRVNQWGVEVLDVAITQVILNPDRIKAFYGEAIKTRESQEVERKARDEARQREILGAIEHKLLQERYSLQEDHTRNLEQIRVDKLSQEQKAQALGAALGKEPRERWMRQPTSDAIHKA